MNLRAIHKALVLFLLAVSMLMPAKMGIGQVQDYVRLKTIAGYGTGAGEIYGPFDSAIDELGDVYVTNVIGSVQKFGSDGSFKSMWPNLSGEPHGITVGGDGNVYIAMRSGGNVSVYSKDGQYLRSFPTDGYPRTIKFHPDGYLVLCFDTNSTIKKYALDGTFLSSFGSSGSFDGQFTTPYGMAIDALGNIYVSDSSQRRISKFAADGTFIMKFGTPGNDIGQLSLLTGISVDSNGNLFACEHWRSDGQPNRVLRFSSLDGAFLGEFFDSISDPIGLGVVNVLPRNNGNLWVLFNGNGIGSYPFSNIGEFRKGVDTSPPATVFTPTLNGSWSTADVSVKIIGTDSGSGVKEIHYSINMGAEQIVSSATATFTLSDNGIHSISYFAVDNAGNTETTQLATVKIDKIAPVTTLTRSAGLITLSATDAHSGVAKIRYQVNGGAVADYSAPFAETVHKVTYWAEDAAGNIEASITDIINAGVQAISVTQPRVTGGIGVVGTVTLDKPAGVGGTVINLASSLPGVAVVDSTVTVPEGATTATFDIDANPVSTDTSVSITASIYETSQSVLVNVLAPMPSSVTWSVSPVPGGTSTTGTLSISGPAPTGGTTVSLASSSLSALVGSSVTIPAGAMTTTFTVSTNVVSNDTSAVVSATVYGVKLKSTLSILGPKVTSVTLAASSIASTTATTGTITLSTNAPVGGKVVNLSSSNASVASVPVSVTVVAGTRTATFTITAGMVNANTNAIITATTNGSSGTATITVTPPAAVLSNLTTVVTSVTGGVPVTGTVVLTSPAPTGGAVVTLASSSTTIGTVPASVTVAAGATSATFTITTRTVTATSSLTITATRNGVSKTATITVNPVRVVSALTLNPTSVRGGTNSTGTVTLSGIATEAVVVTLTSGTTAVARVPTSVTVPAGSTTATFTITTLTQTATRTSVITARTGTTSRTATLSVTR